MTLGRASHKPDWVWSEHVGKRLGQMSCKTARVGLAVAGHNRVTMDDGDEFDMGPGDLFAIEPGHDSLVVGDEPYVSLRFLGAETYGPRTEQLKSARGSRTSWNRTPRT
jgi:hypothetical protein